MTDARDPSGPAPLAATAKPKRGRPSKLSGLSVQPTPLAKDGDPFATPPDRNLASVPSTAGGGAPHRSKPRRPTLSLVTEPSAKATTSLSTDDDPFGPSDPADLSPAPKLPDDRRCGLDDPFGPALQLPFVAVGRDWDGCLRLHALGVNGPLEQRSLRTTHEAAAFAEAERVAIKLNAMLIAGIQSSFTITAIESTIKATAAALKVGA